MTIYEYLELESPAYQDGLNILKKHRKNSAICKMLAFGISKTNWLILKKELHVLMEEIETKKLEEKSKVSLEIKNDEDAYRLIKNINKNEFSRIYNIFLVHLNSKNIKVRYKAAADIVKSYEEIIVPTQRDLKHYHANNSLPDDHYLKKEIITNEISLTQKKLNLRSNISRNKKRPDKAAQVRLWEIELLQVINQENALRNQ